MKLSYKHHIKLIPGFIRSSDTTGVDADCTVAVMTDMHISDGLVMDNIEGGIASDGLVMDNIEGGTASAHPGLVTWFFIHDLQSQWE